MSIVQKNSKPNNSKRAVAIRTGERIKQCRVERGFTQEDVELRTGFAQGIMSHYEAGRRSPTGENLKKLCAALDVTSDWLLEI